MNMMTPFFRSSTYKAPTKKQLDLALNEFSELLSRDMSLPQISDAMEITIGSACAYLRMLCLKMGEPVL